MIAQSLHRWRDEVPHSLRCPGQHCPPDQQDEHDDVGQSGCDVDNLDIDQVNFISNTKGKFIKHQYSSMKQNIIQRHMEKSHPITSLNMIVSFKMIGILTGCSKITIVHGTIMVLLPAPQIFHFDFLIAYIF